MYIWILIGLKNIAFQRTGQQKIIKKTLRRIYSGIIIPGYYMNKVHWNSLLLNKIDAVTEQLVMEMIDSSYDTVLKSLPKKKQKEIEEM